jgi:hypothetical protein
MKVRATEEVVVGLDDGTTVAVRAGDTFNSTDPVVKQHPWLFEERVEQASAAPGERRNR